MSIQSRFYVIPSRWGPVGDSQEKRNIQTLIWTPIIITSTEALQHSCQPCSYVGLLCDLYKLPVWLVFNFPSSALFIELETETGRVCGEQQGGPEVREVILRFPYKGRSAKANVCLFNSGAPSE